MNDIIIEKLISEFCKVFQIAKKFYLGELKEKKILLLPYYPTKGDIKNND